MRSVSSKSSLYFFGLSNALKFDEEYIIELTFIKLITDAQWAVSDATSVVAKIYIGKNNFDYKK